MKFADLSFANDGESSNLATSLVMRAALMSPNFLFLCEKPGKLDDFALASRLSYFLWSTMPDDELLDLAEKKKLSDPKTLHAQVERMLIESFEHAEDDLAARNLRVERVEAERILAATRGAFASDAAATRASAAPPRIIGSPFLTP